MLPDDAPSPQLVQGTNHGGLLVLAGSTQHLEGEVTSDRRGQVGQLTSRLESRASR